MKTIRVNRCVHCMADLTDAGDVSVCPGCGKNPLVVDHPMDRRIRPLCATICIAA